MENVNYLRLSVSDRCNLNCFFCPPLTEKEILPHQEILSFEEIISLVEILMKVGIKRVRITGGEPLLRRDLVKLVKMLSSLGLDDLSLTTNGVLLSGFIKDLKKAGLKRINVSLHTLDRNKFKKLTGLDGLEKVFAGIESAQENSSVIKINTIPLKGFNEDEISNFASLSMNGGKIIRFIEYFDAFNGRSKYTIPNESIKNKIEKEFGKLIGPVEMKGGGPAVYFKIKGSAGTIGFINSYKKDFCVSCSRLRLSSDGKLFSCLFAGDSLDLKRLSRENLPEEIILGEIKRLVSDKVPYVQLKNKNKNLKMRFIGG